MFSVQAVLKNKENTKLLWVKQTVQIMTTIEL